MQKIPYMPIIGDKEVEEGTLSVRRRGEDGDLGCMSVEEFTARLIEEIKTKFIG